MSMLASVKDAVLGRAMRLVGDPRISKLMSDPRLMNAAMKALSVGQVAKTEIDKASRLAACALGWASQEEVKELRSTIQSLQDTISHLEAGAAATEAESKPATSPESKTGGNGKSKDARKA